jgi:hypothetical protein
MCNDDRLGFPVADRRRPDDAADVAGIDGQELIEIVTDASLG